MSKKKSVLVATVGTRDVAFCDAFGAWLNVGNAYISRNNNLSEQVQVQTELGLENADFRLITEYLLENWQEYQERLQPIIMGKMLADYAKEIKQIYLIGTDQQETVEQRSRDTKYSAGIISNWISKHYQIPTKIILQGKNGENPADFEQMFRWWKEIWQENIAPNIKDNYKVLLCIKGGIGAMSEAARVSALSRFGENTLFFDFVEDKECNRLGNPSPYTPPNKGTNYLWDRQQQEALILLNRYDYEGVNRILRPYYRHTDHPEINTKLVLQLQSALAAAIAWNQGNFAQFANLSCQSRNLTQQWWWNGYEAAYLGLIRYYQDNNVEALFHSFRAVEGIMSDWAFFSFPDDIILVQNAYSLGTSPVIKRSIIQHQGLQKYLNQFRDQLQIPLYGRALDILLQTAKPEYKHCRDMQKFWDVVKDNRNQIFHRLLGLDKGDLFSAWDTSSLKEWQSRVLGCLNFISGQNYNSLSEASLMSKVHQELYNSISSYQP
ncbi:MAG: hypothetical protein AAFQ80_05090 [Cyanobacteria bacterium J06621_8]